MTTALNIESMMTAAKVPGDKARTIAEALTKSLQEEYVSKAELQLSHQDVMHAVKTQGTDVMNHVSLTETNLVHRIDVLYLKSSVTLGGIVVVSLGIFFALLKAFP